MKYYLESLGCAKNMVDSERFAGILKAHRFRQTDDPGEADVVLVNSCAFLISALGELDDTLCELYSLMNRKKARLIVTGCVMNRAQAEFKELFPEVNKWVGLKDFAAFEKYLCRYVLPQGTKPLHTAEPERIKLEYGQHVYLRIADGCENHCTYCMIPSIRGKLVSEPIEKLVAEAKMMVGRGRELVLIAQDTCMYGMDLYGEKALPKLIDALNKIPGYDWLRIMYLHPDHFELEWTELWQRYPKLLPYFEIPIQHVSDRIIKAMNRTKSYTELKALFDHIQQEVPQAVFRTTLMLGYPGETKADRDLINKFLTQVDILHCGVFGYSPEKEAPAYETPEGFDYRKVEKLEIALAKKLAKAKEEKMQRYVGTIQMAMVEGYDSNMQAHVGRLWFQAPEIDGFVYIDELPEGKGPLVNVEIVHALGDQLMSEYHS